MCFKSLSYSQMSWPNSLKSERSEFNGAASILKRGFNEAQERVQKIRGAKWRKSNPALKLLKERLQGGTVGL